MPTTQVLTPPDATAEPITRALLAAQCRLDLDPDSTDPAIQAQWELLDVYRSAAREKVEAYTGRLLAAQEVEYSFSLDEPYQLPVGATATAVRGFLTDLAQLPTLGQWLEEYRKGISTNRELDWPYPALAQTYTVTASIAAPVVPALAKTAMLLLAAEMYRDREPTTELSVSWKMQLQQLVVNPLGVSA